MTLAERLTLVLAGFGMTYAVDEKEMQLQLKWMPQAVAVDRVYPTRVDAKRIIPVLRKDYPQAFFRGEGNELRVRSTIEDHWAIEAYLSPDKRSAKSTDGQQVYSLTVKDRPLGPVVEQICRRGSTCKLNSAWAQVKLKDVRVSFAVTNVTLEELFQAVCGTGQADRDAGWKSRADRIAVRRKRLPRRIKTSSAAQHVAPGRLTTGS